VGEADGVASSNEACGGRRHAATALEKGQSQRPALGGLQLHAAEGDVSCFHKREDFVARHEVHFLDRARCNDRSDFADARLDDYFTEDFVGHNAFHGSRELVADAFFHKLRR